MASKKELIAELVAIGANESEIKNMKVAELEGLLAKMKKDYGSAEAVEKEEPEKKVEEQPKAEERNSGKIVRETSHQLGIHSDYIYNVNHRKAKVVIENLGYGDIYYATDDLAVVGKSNRLTFGQVVELEGVDKVCFTSASQPVVQILEIL